MMTTYESLTAEQRVRASLHRDIQAVCKEACHCLGLDITKPAMDLLFEMIMHKITCYADDLEAFARHAKRFVITGDDVKLLARRNKSLRTRLDTILPPAPPSTTKETGKRRRTTVPLSAPAKKLKPQEDHDNDKEKDKSIDLTDD